MPYFTDERLKQIPDDPIDGLRQICDLLSDFCQTESRQDGSDIDTAVEFHSIISAFIGAHQLPYQFDGLPDDPQLVIRSVCGMGGFLRQELERSAAERLGRTFRSRFAAHFSKTEGYHLTDGDITEINDIVAKLRSAIGSSEHLDDKHKQRILKRLESLQSEIHKKVSDFDRIIGTVCEVLVVVKKVGEAAEPWGRLAKSLLEIVWRSQAHAFELPSSAKMDLLKEEAANKAPEPTTTAVTPRAPLSVSNESFD